MEMEIVQINTTINHRMRVTRARTNAGAVMGMGTDGDGEEQSNNRPFVARVRVRMKGEMKRVGMTRVGTNTHERMTTRTTRERGKGEG